MTKIYSKPSPLEVVLDKLEERGLSRDALKIHDIREEEINTMAWETATKLSKLFSIEPGFWMNLCFEYEMSMRKKR